MSERAFGRWFPIASLATIGLLAASAGADARSDAKAAYQRGVAAHKRGDEATAAREFASADASLPNTSALLAALQAVTKTDDAALAADLLERKKREPDAKVAEAAAAAEGRFKDRLGWLHLDCGSAPACDAQLGERKLGAGADVRVAAGTHTLRVHRGEVEASITVTVQPGSTARVVAPEPPVTPTPPTPPTASATAKAAAPSETVPATVPPGPAATATATVAARPQAPPFIETLRGKPLPPFVVYAGGAVALAAGISGIAVLVHAGSKETEFQDAGCTGSSPPASSDCKSRASTGRTLDVVGNALLLGGAALGLGTVLVSAFLVDWRGKGTVSVAPVPGGAVGAYRTEF